MVRWTDLPDYEQDALVLIGKDCITLEPAPWVTGVPLAERRVAIVTTAGLQRRGDRSFTKGAGDFRIIPGDYDAADLVMSHIADDPLREAADRFGEMLTGAKEPAAGRVVPIRSR